MGLRSSALAVLAVATAFAGAGAAGAAAPLERPSAIAAKRLVTTFRTSEFGRVLARADRQALYYWTPEKRSPGRIRCIGECAELWPPLTVPKGVAVPRRLKGIRGIFGIIRRPDGPRQLTYDRLPLYAYAHEGPGVVLCDDVDGWFVVRV